MEAVFKSNRFLETLLVILIMLIPTISMADSTTTIPLTSSYWQSLDIGYGTGTMSTTSDGLKINGVGSRQGAGLRTISTYNMVGATIYIKWKASGSGYMGANAGIEYDYTNDYAYIGIANSGGYLTTDHSYGGSTVISDNTWYYTRIKLNSDQTYTVVTASSNYDDSGGTTLLSYSGTYSGNNWSYFQSEYVFVYLWDNYGGTSAYMVVGEAKVKFSVPLTSSYWQSLDIGYGTGTMSTTSDGMKINGVGYRQGAGLKTSNTYNLVGTETYIKWLAYGSGYMGANAGIFYDMNSTGGEISPAGSAQPLTTDHSYGGSTLISDSTWYYTRIYSINCVKCEITLNGNIQF
ncbi:MAG: hypothetical protein HQK90_12670 [Nitrospirae bacterium]|nr:hypothetical protein [Nitrospirota bacterium]